MKLKLSSHEKLYFFSYDAIVSLVLCVPADLQTDMYCLYALNCLDVHASVLRETLLTCPEQGGRKRDPCETELSDILLSFIECEAKQEQRTAVSSLTPREADEEQKSERRERKRESGRELYAL